MKFIRLLITLFGIISFSICIYAQDLIERTQQRISSNPPPTSTTTRIYNDIKKIDDLSNQKSFKIFEFDKSKYDESDYNRYLSKAPVYLKLNQQTFSQVYDNNQYEILQLTIPVDEQNRFSLILKEYNILSSSFNAATNTGQDIDYSGIKTFRGFIEGDPSSVVSMTISENDTRVLISDYSGNYSLGNPDKEHPENYILLNEAAIIEKKEFVCNAYGDYEPPQNLPDHNVHKSGTSSIGCIDIYVEMDHDLYLSSGTVENSVFNAISLFNEVATIYCNENIDINISYLKVWSTADPYKFLTNGDSIIDVFGDNLQNSFNGDLAHLLKGVSVGGGAAWLDVLGASYCSNCGTGGISTGPYGYSTGMNDFSTNFPNFSWEVMVVTHEIGHNLGSPHTHSCVWNGNNTAIDGCAPVENGTCTRPPSPPGGGTIMSYCHNDPVQINFTLGFGTQPGDLIRSKLSTAINSNSIDGTCSCSVPCPDDFVLADYGSTYTRGWGVLQPRIFGDINGDGKDDVVGFGNNNVEVALSTGSDLIKDNTWNLPFFGYTNGGWNVNLHQRHVIDVNGDGMEDIVGFGNAAVYVAISTGNNFNAPIIWANGYGPSNGWTVDDHPRIFGDFNNDNLNDFVGFANGLAIVEESTGTSFVRNASFNLAHFYFNQGWSSVYPRLVGDVDGDGFDDDIVGFGPNVVQVVTSNGSTFSAVNSWTTNFTSGEGWSPSVHLRFLADVDGDGKDDAVGFASEGVRVGLSTGTSFNPHTSWIGGFGVNQGWTIANHPRYMADVNGDGMADIIGFANAGVYISLSTGSNFDVPILIKSCYGHSDNWSSASYIRNYADFQGDGIPDIVAMGCGGTYVYFRDNDDCASAANLMVNGSCNSITSSINNKTSSGELPAFSCGITGATIDAWFAVTVPPSGDLTIESTQVAGGLSDMVMQVLSGTCGAFTEVACNDDGGVGTHSLINIVGRTPGETLYVRVVEYGSDSFGEFGICAYDNSCPTERTFANGNMLTGNQSTNADYEAAGKIQSDQLIISSTSGTPLVDYDSGLEICLDPDFEVQLGAIFHAFIDGCGGSQLQENEDNKE